MARFSLKFIKPKRNPFDYTKYEAEIKDELADLGSEIVEEFNEITNDWETDVTFRAEVRVEQDAVKLQVRPRGNTRIWRYVDEGTRPHIIRAVNGPFLIYRKGYSARTRPGQAHVGSGTATGSWARRPFVNHPGSAAREFTPTIMHKYEPEFKRAIDTAVRKGANG